MIKEHKNPSANNQEKAIGMPDIASEANNKDKPYVKAVLLVLASLLVLFFIWKTHSEKNTKAGIKTPDTEENYAVQNTTQNPQTTKKPQNADVTTSAATQLTEEQRQALLALEKERQARLQASVLLVGKTSSNSQTSAKNVKKVSTDPNTQFLEQLSTQDGDTISATAMGNQSLVLAEGTLIHGVLESAINSDLPGMIRAIVSEPVYSEDAAQVLIEPGSRLIGQYKSGMQQGQTRVFVVWTTLIQPTGSRIKLASPGVDNLGVAGVQADNIDYHFWERFGTSGLLSIIGAGAANVGVNNKDPYNASQAYRQAVAQNFAESARDAYKQNGAIPPTLHIEQGKPIMVFVAHTLDFSKVVKRSQQKISVF